MKLSKKAIEEFRELYKKEYGIDITYEFATEEAERLMRIMYIALQKYLKKR